MKKEFAASSENCIIVTGNNDLSVKYPVNKIHITLVIRIIKLVRKYKNYYRAGGLSNRLTITTKKEASTLTVQLCVRCTRLEWFVHPEIIFSHILLGICRATRVDT